MNTRHRLVNLVKKVAFWGTVAVILAFFTIASLLLSAKGSAIQPRKGK